MLVFAKPTQGINGMAQAGAAHVGADDDHGVHDREGGGGAGDGDEDRRQGVLEFDAHLFGQQFEFVEDLVPLPGAQGFHAPEGELQQFLLFVDWQLVGGEVGFGQVQHAGYQEAGQRGEVAQGVHARLGVGQGL